MTAVTAARRASRDVGTPKVRAEIVMEFPGRAMPVVVKADDRAVTGLRFGTAADQAAWLDGCRAAPEGHPVIRVVEEQLRAYAAGERDRFDLPLHLEGTPFQSAVWSALQEVPYGRTVTYGWLADQVGRPGSARAVGAAVGSNPIGIVVPCHRVIGASGALTGFAGGLDNKIALLAREGVTAL